MNNGIIKQIAKYYSHNALNYQIPTQTDWDMNNQNINCKNYTRRYTVIFQAKYNITMTKNTQL